MCIAPLAPLHIKANEQKDIGQISLLISVYNFQEEATATWKPLVNSAAFLFILGHLQMPLPGQVLTEEGTLLPLPSPS